MVSIVRQIGANSLAKCGVTINYSAVDAGAMHERDEEPFQIHWRLAVSVSSGVSTGGEIIYTISAPRRARIACMKPPTANDDILRPILADRYETLVQLSPDALYVVQDGRLVFINAAGTHQLSANHPDELIGLALIEILHPEYHARCQARIESMLASGRPTPLMEQKYLRRDGSVIDVEVCSAPFLYLGKPAIQVIARNITDRKAAEVALRVSEDRYRSVVSCLTEGVVMQSRDGEVLACNPSAERILRMAPNTLVGWRRGTYFKRVINESGVALVGLDLPTECVLRTGQPMLDLVVGVEMMDGVMVWLSENVLPIQNPGETQPSAVLISFTNITVIKDAQQRLKHMATHDSLTGLPNRAFLTERLTHTLELARRADQRVAVLFLDLDRFKSVNDAVGHERGDQLLQTVAERLAACTRDTDTLARLGGDEFVILAQGFDETAYVTLLADRILKAVAEPFLLEENEYFLGVSIGIAVYPDDGEDGATLLRCADSAMYYAKDSGRNGYQFFTAELSARNQRRYLIEKNLRRAVVRDEFLLHYQPKVDLQSGRIVGAEALIRWNDPHAGLVVPDAFIPIAEETGLIIPIGKWVLEQACRQMAAWRAQWMPQLQLAVNLSARQFQDENLVAIVAETLSRTGLPAAALVLEITESLLMGDTAKLMPVFDALTGMGVRFSIDDFGTGYSSLSYLQRFPISNLKIDRSFISGIPGNRDSVALTQAIIAMARTLEMSVTAEGVEQPSQMEFLKQAGCDEMQGFYFSRPVAADRFALLLQQDGLVIGS